MRLLALLLLAIAGATDLSAQRPRAAVGAQVGYSRSDLTGGDASGIRSRQGALTGVFLYFPVVGGVAVRPELLFALKGGRALATVDGGGTAPLDVELAYLELPVLAHYAPAVGRLRPVLFAGPVPALQIGCDFQLLVAEPVRTSCNEAQVAARDWELGLVVGGGAQAQLNRATLALEARYTAGMRSIIDEVDIKNRTFALLVALTF